MNQIIPAAPILHRQAAHKRLIQLKTIKENLKISIKVPQETIKVERKKVIMQK